MDRLTSGNRYLFDTTVFIDIIQQKPPATVFYHQTRFDRIFAGYSILSEAELLQWPGIRGLRNEDQEITLVKAYHRYYVNVTISRDAGRFSRKLHTDYAILVKELRKQDNKQPQREDQPPGLMDCLIAATAKYYDLILVSSDQGMGKFRQFEVAVELYHQQSRKRDT